MKEKDGVLRSQVGKRHVLKTWPNPFWAILHGRKTFEFRKNDRGFNVGDVLELREYDPALKDYTGTRCEVRVTFVLLGGMYGVPFGYCVMSISAPVPVDAEGKQVLAERGNPTPQSLHAETVEEFASPRDAPSDEHLTADGLLAASPPHYWQPIVDEIEAAGTEVRFAVLLNHQAAHLLAWATIARDAAKLAREPDARGKANSLSSPLQEGG